MKLKELLTIIQGTQIQKEVLVKKYTGSNIEIHTDVHNITNVEVRVSWFHFTSDEDGYIDDDNIGVSIQHEEAKFGTQLISYSYGDRVIIVAKLLQVYLTERKDIYEFELISIRKISSIIERKKAEEADREAKRKAEEEAERKRNSGCFVATACYGNYDAPEVLVLRQFRDDTLLKNSFGEAFVNFYYSVSPFFAKLLSKSDVLKKSVRRYFLEPIVNKLQRQNKP
jgi:hypothetical protein